MWEFRNVTLLERSKTIRCWRQRGTSIKAISTHALFFDGSTIFANVCGNCNIPQLNKRFTKDAEIHIIAVQLFRNFFRHVVIWLTSWRSGHSPLMTNVSEGFIGICLIVELLCFLLFQIPDTTF